ncbi:Hypothetical predicted protein [Olea europaea subsp. europaea]|uniref:Uncharacterized protein n=1 Tax=Olea europaea subsp. europaea TaxID=158383 RepID=A0A8S0SJX6_OLEEU|nr:Hypothetical predicted protein [Olea europaea subsp. europaea]
MAVLTARDGKRGNEALEKLKGFGLSENVVFHQLAVMDPTSIAALANFITKIYEKLDISVEFFFFFQRFYFLKFYRFFGRIFCLLVNSSIRMIRLREKTSK